MFVNIQHPGESTTYWNNQFGAPTTSNPSSVSNWPYGDAGNPRRPRPATVVIRRQDGGRVGS
jgi:secreted PhoX family phosphatase